VKRARNQISYQFPKPATAALVLLVAVVACETRPAKYEKILTKEIAEQFLENVNSVDLSEFAAIENAAAASLSDCRGDLYLNGLTSLSDLAAASLSYSCSLHILCYENTRDE
jgi:hypothetical protein